MPQDEITISVDAMGGAEAPDAIIDGIKAISSQYDKVKFIIFGHQDKVLDKLSKLNKQNYEFRHTEEEVSDHAKPIYAFKNAKQSSMRKAIEAVKEGEAHACVSGGNTGALMVMSKMVLGGLYHIKRPAIIGQFPTKDSHCVILDLGANAECNELHLFQFALMGNCFAKVLLAKESPRIGVLNVGAEQLKGRGLEQKTDELLRASGLNYHGFIEAHEITKGVVDVVVTDGFTGNVALKASEGSASFISELIKKSFTTNGSIAKLVGLAAKRIMAKTLYRISPSNNNGAMFIGIGGIVVKSHGSSNAQGIMNAIKVAYQLSERDVNKHIVEELQELEQKGVGTTIIDKLRTTSARIFGIDKK